jgi:hypothetical protein
MTPKQIALVQASWTKLLASGDPAGLVPVVEALRRSDRHQAAADALLRLLERGLDKGKAA